MKPLQSRHLWSLGGLSVLGGFFACREPTQITVDITTDTRCPSQTLTGPRLVDVMFASGVTLDMTSIVEVTTTAQCTTPDPDDQTDTADIATIGSLVLLPGADNPAVEVLVVAGVELAAPNADVSPLRLSSAECRDLIQAGGVGAVGGKPCILSRRRLGFVDHTRLVLPVDLDSRCIGKRCGEDESCSKGNCIPIDVDCDEGGCAEPAGCSDDCDAGCGSGAGRCNQGSCECLPCDAQVCGDACALEQAVGSCSDEDLCLCVSCDQSACSDLCDGQCVDGACQCPTCDTEQCATSGDDCSCLGAPENTCECVVPDCMDATCADLAGCELGQMGVCGMNEQGMDTCTCTCVDALCNDECPQGGSCDGSSCECTLCDEAVCNATSCGDGELGQCYDGGCLCICEETNCDAFCAPMSGSCDDPSAPDGGNCQCSSGPSGGGGQGGDGGNGGFGGTTTVTGGFGGTGGDGGFGGTTNSSGGFGGGGPCDCGPVVCGPGQFCELADNCTCECQAGACQSYCQFTVGQSGTCIGTNPGNCMCDPPSSGGGGFGPTGGFGASLCTSGAQYPLPGCTLATCTTLCNMNDCLTGTCINSNTCECN